MIFQATLDEARRLAAGHRERIAKERTPAARATLCRKLARRLQGDLAAVLLDTIESQLRNNATLVTEFARCLDEITKELAATPQPAAAPVQAIGGISR
jgi:hypothetical protein